VDNWDRKRLTAASAQYVGRYSAAQRARAFQRRKVVVGVRVGRLEQREDDRRAKHPAVTAAVKQRIESAGSA
jgi:hypothetical protein